NISVSYITKSKSKITRYCCYLPENIPQLFLHQFFISLHSLTSSFSKEGEKLSHLTCQILKSIAFICCSHSCGHSPFLITIQIHYAPARIGLTATVFFALLQEKQSLHW